jgi:hypothetical protein
MGEPFYLETTMKKYVIVATKGRASEVGHLLDALLEQTCLADGIYVIGSEPADLAGLNAHPIHLRTRVRLLISATPGTTFQRNRGIDALLKDQDVESYDPSDEAWFAVFFDDDFRPARNWLDACAEVFGSERRVVAVTGRLLADGIKGPGLTEEQAHAYLSGALPPQAHWASGDAQRAVSCVYGCNMAFTDRVIRTCRFDEALPLYGWQEDQDFTGQAARLGKVVYEPGCVGVHLGSKHGRTSGRRLGYSQIANPVFLMKKRTMRTRKALALIARSLLSNALHSFGVHPLVDYRGRFKGNLLACADLLRGIDHPQRVLQIDR